MTLEDNNTQEQAIDPSRHRRNGASASSERTMGSKDPKHQPRIQPPLCSKTPNYDRVPSKTATLLAKLQMLTLRAIRRVLETPRNTPRKQPFPNIGASIPMNLREPVSLAGMPKFLPLLLIPCSPQPRREHAPRPSPRPRDFQRDDRGPRHVLDRSHANNIIALRWRYLNRFEDHLGGTVGGMTPVLCRTPPIRSSPGA